MAKNLLAALDLGSEVMKLAVAQASSDKKVIQTILFLQTASAGVRRGVVVGVDKASQAIAGLVKEAKSKLRRDFDDVVVNVAGSHLFCTRSRGVVAVSRADQQISQEDVERVIAAAQALSLPLNKEMLEAFPQEFVVDGEGGVKDPQGMKGMRLEVEIIAICGFSPYLKNLTEAVTRAELDIIDLVPSAAAVARAVLTQKQKELGCVILDIGAWTTDLAVFQEGELVNLQVLPMGSGHITSDIAIGLQTEFEVAEHIKLNFGSAVPEKKGKSDKVELSVKEHIAGEKINEKIKDEKIVFSRKLLSHIISARISELFSEVEKELKKIAKPKMLPAGLVLTGGGANLDSIDLFAKKYFKLPAKIGYPKGIEGLAREPASATIAGLLLRGFDLQQGSERARPGPGIFSRLLRVFLPES